MWTTQNTVWSWQETSEMTSSSTDAEQNIRLVMIDLEEDVIVHVDYAEHRLVMTDLGDDVIIHVDWLFRLVMIDLGENVIVHVDWADHRLIMIDLG